MTKAISNEALDIIFRQARSHNGWKSSEISDEQLQALYDLMKMGPTSANASPARIVFLKSNEAKEKLKPSMDAANVEKVMSAPVVAIIAMDMQFYDLLPKLFPHDDARSWYAGKDEKILETAFRNSSLQGAYFIIAARCVGLDCGPMSGFNTEKLEQTFFPDGRFKANFVCAIGEGENSKLFPRLPRLEFNEACQII